MKFYGDYYPPGDKSITHRALIIAAISDETCRIENALISEDTLATVDCLRALGVEIEIEEDKNIITVFGVGLHGLKEPNSPLDCKNSGTTMRLLSGILVAQRFPSILIGDESLSKRPMERVVEPLALMGADIKADSSGNAPLVINPVEKLDSITYELVVPSAQVKSAIQLASLYTGEESLVTGDKTVRNHTDMMLAYFKDNGYRVNKYIVPGDFSSAAFFIAGTLLLEDSYITVKDVGINPTRIGFLEVLQRMGANIDLDNIRVINNELIGDLEVRHSDLTGVHVYEEEIPSLIDEIPILSIIASLSRSETLLRGVSELKAKETDRLKLIVDSLSSIGFDVKSKKDDLIISRGKNELKACTLDAKNDHRFAMSFEILKLATKLNFEIINGESYGVSYPNFYSDLHKINGGLK